MLKPQEMQLRFSQTEPLWYVSSSPLLHPGKKKKYMLLYPQACNCMGIHRSLNLTYKAFTFIYGPTF